MKDIFKVEIPNDIFIKDGKILSDTPEKIKVLKIDPDSKQLEQYNYDNDIPIDKDGKPVIFDNKKRDMDSKEYKNHAESRKKQDLIKAVQERWSILNKKEVTTISKEFSISILTAKKYIHMVEVAAILSYTIRTGYKGNLNTMESYIKLIAKNNFNRILHMNWAYKFEYPDNIVVIKRNGILKYITTKNPKVKKDENIGKYLDIIKKKYEIISVLEMAYDEFYKMLMGKEVDQLENFIKKSYVAFQPNLE